MPSHRALGVWGMECQPWAMLLSLSQPTGLLTLFGEEKAHPPALSCIPLGLPPCPVLRNSGHRVLRVESAVAFRNEREQPKAKAASREDASRWCSSPCCLTLQLVKVITESYHLVWRSSLLPLSPSVELFTPHDLEEGINW